MLNPTMWIQPFHSNLLQSWLSVLLLCVKVKEGCNSGMRRESTRLTKVK